MIFDVIFANVSFQHRSQGYLKIYRLYEHHCLLFCDFYAKTIYKKEW